MKTILNKCAYCPSTGPFTKEHIWPKSLIQRYEKLRTFSPKNNKFYTGEAVIKDVCAICNNESLSPLDTYLANLFDAGLGKILNAGEAAQLEYDYDLLLRALLKISYNSARAFADPKTKALHSSLARFVTAGLYCPKIMLRLQIVTNSRAINPIDKSEHIMSPELMRCGTIQYEGPLSERFCVRMVAINSFWFYLIIPYKNEPPHKWDKFIEGLRKLNLSGVIVPKGNSLLNIPKEKTTYMHMALLGSLVNADNT